MKKKKKREREGGENGGRRQGEREINKIKGRGEQEKSRRGEGDDADVRLSSSDELFSIAQETVESEKAFTLSSLFLYFIFLLFFIFLLKNKFLFNFYKSPKIIKNE